MLKSSTFAWLRRGWLDSRTRITRKWADIILQTDLSCIFIEAKRKEEEEEEEVRKVSSAVGPPGCDVM